MGPSGLALQPEVKISKKTIASIDLTEIIKKNFEAGYTKAAQVVEALHKESDLKKPVLVGENLVKLLQNSTSREPLTVTVKNGEPGETSQGFLKENKPRFGNISVLIEFGRNAGAQELAVDRGITMNAKGRIFATPEFAAKF